MKWGAERLKNKEKTRGVGTLKSSQDDAYGRGRDQLCQMLLTINHMLQDKGHNFILISWISVNKGLVRGCTREKALQWVQSILLSSFALRKWKEPKLIIWERDGSNRCIHIPIYECMRKHICAYMLYMKQQQDSISIWLWKI